MYEILVIKGLKLTNQRCLVIDAITKLGLDATLKSIYNECIKYADKSTIYRILEIFIEKQVLEKKINKNNEVYYEIKPIKHMHYITCIKCNKKTEIDFNSIKKFEQSIGKDYKLISHNIEFYGICSECE